VFGVFGTMFDQVVVDETVFDESHIDVINGIYAGTFTKVRVSISGESNFERCELYDLLLVR